jgi:hypothetical protein
MVDYCNNRVDWYIDQLKVHNFYLSRKSSQNSILTAYLISANDWRHTVIISCQLDQLFRLQLLYVNEEDSFSYTENGFDEMIAKISNK